MVYQFKKHYTRDEARALLPRIRAWLGQMDRCRERLDHCEKRVSALSQGGADSGGPAVNEWISSLVELGDVLRQFESRGILLKDPDRGLLDFPAIIGGREVFLCWEKDEDDIEFWHDLDSGYAGRERI